jgi:hypothetical protein
MRTKRRTARRNRGWMLALWLTVPTAAGFRVAGQEGAFSALSEVPGLPGVRPHTLDQPEPLAHLVAESIGSPTSELFYTPVSPCRILDTRPGNHIQGEADGPVPAGTTIAFHVADGGFFGNQAVPPVCHVPPGAAKAAVINIVAVAPAGAGDLRIWPWDDTFPPAPNSSVLNYANAAGLNIANGLIVPICNSVTATDGSCAQDVFLRPDVSATHVVIDVLGYFAPPQATAVDCIFTSAGEDISGGFAGDLASPSCPATFPTLVSGACYSSGTSTIYLRRSFFDGNNNRWICTWTTLLQGGSDHISTLANCCRAPGR